MKLYIRDSYNSTSPQVVGRKGFALVVVSVLIIVLGTLLVTMMPDDSKKLIEKTYNTDARLQQVLDAIDMYYSITGTLPCPARLDLAEDHPNFGKSDCLANGDGQVFRQGNVRIGGVPTRKLTLTSDAAFDDWNNRIIYIMNYNYKPAVLNVRNLTDTSYVVNGSGKRPVALLLSHGPDGLGAYSKTGELLKACALTGASASKSELENCNFSADAKFISSMWDSSTDSFFDDITKPLFQRNISLPCPVGVHGCTMWLDASDSSTVSTALGGVSEWRDKSPEGNNATQGLFLVRPEYNGSINGLNTINFVLGDILTSPIDTPSFPYTMFAVYKSSALSGMIAGFNKPLGLGVEGFVKNGSNAVTLKQQDGLWTNLSIDSAATGASAHIVASVFTGTDSSFNAKIITDGTTSSTATNSGGRSAGARLFGIGGILNLALFLFTGDIAEIIIYPRVLTTEEMDNVNCYLSNKWGIAISTAC